MKFGLLVRGCDIPSGLKFKLHSVSLQCGNMLWNANMHGDGLFVAFNW
jgi:hypothetical protein